MVQLDGDTLGGFTFLEQLLKDTSLLEIGNEIWKGYYRNVFLEYFDEKVKYKNQQSIKLTRAIV